MHSVPAVLCPDKVIGTKSQIIKIKRGGKGQTSGNGPSGWKLRPSALLARALADMASHYRSRKNPVRAIKKKANGQAEVKLK